MPVTVYFKTPLTDVMGPVANNQLGGPCGNLEMKTTNCMEAYGEGRGLVKCKDLIDDMYECMTKTKQMSRLIQMRAEREKLGEFIDGPAHDSYQYPTLI